MPYADPPVMGRRIEWWRVDLPAAHWSLAVLYAGSCLACLYAVAAPATPGMHVIPKIVVGCAGIAGASAVVLLGRRLGRQQLFTGAAIATVFASFLVADADSDYGAVVAAFGYLWVSIYTALFFSTRAVLFQTGLIATGMAVALLVSDRAHLSLAWVMITLTALMFGMLLQRFSSQLREQARTDALTDALNRRGLVGAARHVFADADRRGQPVSVVMIDLDRFKQVNDELGHDAGDRLLEEVARSLSAALHCEDVLARTGGDEFVIVLPNTTRPQAEHLLARLSEQAAASWSTGVYERAAGETLDVCMSRASSALRGEKQYGRGLEIDAAVPTHVTAS